MPVCSIRRSSVPDAAAGGCVCPQNAVEGGIVSWWLDHVGVIPVDRDAGSDVAAIRRVLQTLRQDNGIILFPEGTRTLTGQLQRPKAGVGLMACRTGVPVVPARIFGSFEAFGRNGPLRIGTPRFGGVRPAFAPRGLRRPIGGQGALPARLGADHGGRSPRWSCRGRG